MSFREFIQRREVPYVAMAVIAVVASCVALLHPMGALDTFMRYAPMADAFSKGDWVNAFHPRFGVGFQALSGSLTWLTGLDGYRSCTVVSTLLWAACLFPLFRLADALFGRTAAWFALALFVICPQTLVWSFKGFRESAKMLGVLLAVDALVRWKSGTWRVALEGALALVFLFLFKVDTAAMGLLFAAAYLFLDRFRLRSIVACGTGLLSLQAMCALVYSWTGWWLPAVQYIPLVKRLIGG